MTLHVAAVYFDYEKRTCGFLLGSDSLGYNRQDEFIGARQTTTEPTLDDRILTEKSFRSPNTIGFCSGEFRWPKDEQESLLRSLDNSFEEISEKRDYSAHQTLIQASYATLSVVRRSETKLQLYGVYVRKAGEAVSVKKHRELRRVLYKSVKNTAFWQDLTVQGTPRLLHDPGRRTREEMHAHLLWILQHQEKCALNRISAPFDIYAVDFEGIRKIA